VNKEAVPMYCDIDNTLINTRKLISLAYKEITKQTKLSLDEVIKIKREYSLTLDSHTDFCPEDFIKFLPQKIEKNPFENSKIYIKSLFNETIPFLMKNKKRFNLGIYSEGFESYQLKKLKLSGIIDYFDKELIIIERRKLTEGVINKIKEGSIVVDNSEEVIEKIENYNNLKPIWVNRKESQTKFKKEIMVVKDLKDLNRLFNIKNI
jgi:RNAse (barnase) inhibitor barstar